MLNICASGGLTPDVRFRLYNGAKPWSVTWIETRPLMPVALGFCTSATDAFGTDSENVVGTSTVHRTENVFDADVEACPLLDGALHSEKAWNVPLYAPFSMSDDWLAVES